jgi:hypothetical protein
VVHFSMTFAVCNFSAQVRHRSAQRRLVLDQRTSAQIIAVEHHGIEGADNGAMI